MLLIIPIIQACIKMVKNTAMADAAAQNVVRLKLRKIFLNAIVKSIPVPPVFISASCGRTGHAVSSIYGRGILRTQNFQD
jgi:hypothetical protein